MSNIITEISPGEVVEFVVTLDVDASVLEGRTEYGKLDDGYA